MHGNGTEGHDMWSDVLIDAALAGQAAVVALLAGMTFAGVKVDPWGALFVLTVAFFTAFISSIQAARGRRSSVGTKSPVKERSPRR